MRFLTIFSIFGLLLLSAGCAEEVRFKIVDAVTLKPIRICGCVVTTEARFYDEQYKEISKGGTTQDDGSLTIKCKYSSDWQTTVEFFEHHHYNASIKLNHEGITGGTAGDALDFAWERLPDGTIIVKMNPGPPGKTRGAILDRSDLFDARFIPQ